MDLKEGAILISDVHYHNDFRREDFISFLEKVEERNPPQLILLGDIFELLFGGVKSTIRANQNLISKINTLSEKFEIIYFEGNHDFNLEKLFPKIEVIPIVKQPLLMKFNNLDLYLSHGDSEIGGVFYLYRRLINQNFLLKTLSFFDSIFNDLIIRKLENIQKKREKCYKIKGFKDIIKKKLKRFDGNVLIEGHYHQGIDFIVNNISYYNLSSFACNQSCFIVKSKQNTLFIKNISLKEL
jgi:UDP-2,3-diacylglucosamine hydrolase